MSHPEPQQLERFMRGESPRDERLLIVRHLLTGCPDCSAITREIWDFADHPLLSCREQISPSGRDARSHFFGRGSDRAARPHGRRRDSKPLAI